MKNKKAIISLIVILSLLVVGLSVGMAILINKSFDFNFKFNFDNSNSKLIDGVTFDNENINNIKVDVYDIDIEIKKSDDNFRVEYYSNSDNDRNPKIVNEDNSIMIYEDEYNTSCIGFCNINKKIVLYIPYDYIGKFDLKTISGDIKSLIDMANDVNIKTTSGDISLLSVINVDIETTSGDIDIDKVNSMIKIKTISGDISLEYLDIKENSSLKTTSGDIDISNNVSDCYVEASTVSGDTYINKSNRKSDLILNIGTISGDVTVN